MNIPERNNIDISELSANLTFQWIRDGKAFFIKINSSKQVDIDTYIDANIQALKMWDKSQTFYSIQDVSHPNVTITPYFRERLEQITIKMKESQLQGHSVIIISNSIFGRAVQIYGRIFARKVEPIYQYWVLNQERAFKTLDDLMAKHS